MKPEKKEYLLNLSRDTDFTEEHYRKLLKIGKKNYKFSGYSNIDWKDRFLLWRHDLDHSLNRGLALAKIESAENVSATYFINPHSEYYNIAETSQHNIVNEIIALKHDIGLHFHTSFYEIKSKDHLDECIFKEAEYLYSLFGVRPFAFSFHDPVDSILSYDDEHYGGLLNCYSKIFKQEVSYCSDSNGYWRFKRLYDVLEKAEDENLQVLTHPGLWQEKPMPPRQRIYRAAYGRALFNINCYDRGFNSSGRLNKAGFVDNLYFLKDLDYAAFNLCDYLWNNHNNELLFLELWRIHQTQLFNLCKGFLIRVFRLSSNEIDEFFERLNPNYDFKDIFEYVFNVSISDISSISKNQYRLLFKISKQLINSRYYGTLEELDKESEMVAQLVRNLSEWGSAQDFQYSGIGDFICKIKAASDGMDFEGQDETEYRKNGSVKTRTLWLKTKKKFKKQ